MPQPLTPISQPPMSVPDGGSVVVNEECKGLFWSPEVDDVMTTPLVHMYLWDPTDCMQTSFSFPRQQTDCGRPPSGHHGHN